jgi:hypothetical protein
MENSYSVFGDGRAREGLGVTGQDDVERPRLSPRIAG